MRIHMRIDMRIPSRRAFIILLLLYYHTYNYIIIIDMLIPRRRASLRSCQQAICMAIRTSMRMPGACLCTCAAPFKTSSIEPASSVGAPSSALAGGPFQKKEEGTTRRELMMPAAVEFGATAYMSGDIRRIFSAAPKIYPGRLFFRLMGAACFIG